jgi:hypothetical protein
MCSTKLHDTQASWRYPLFPKTNFPLIPLLFLFHPSSHLFIISIILACALDGQIHVCGDTLLFSMLQWSTPFKTGGAVHSSLVLSPDQRTIYTGTSFSDDSTPGLYVFLRSLILLPSSAQAIEHHLPSLLFVNIPSCVCCFITLRLRQTALKEV